MAGRLLSSQKDPQAAQAQFETAYRRAVGRDDAAAIGDAGYDLAAAQLAQDHAADALSTTESARRALALRGHVQTPELSLVKAASLYRLGRDREAMDAARLITMEPDVDLAERAIYVLGLAADGAGDVQTLAGACNTLRRPPKMPSLVRLADANELAARLALDRGDQKGAEEAALAASVGRRTLLDYRGMRIALRLAAVAAGRSGAPTRAAAYEQQAAESLASDL